MIKVNVPYYFLSVCYDVSLTKTILEKLNFLYIYLKIKKQQFPRATVFFV